MAETLRASYIGLKMQYINQTSRCPDNAYKGLTCSIGHSLRHMNHISAVRQWLIRDTTYTNNFYFNIFLLNNHTSSKFKIFKKIYNRSWTIENHRFSPKIDSKHQFLSCYMTTTNWVESMKSAEAPWLVGISFCWIFSYVVLFVYQVKIKTNTAIPHLVRPPLVRIAT